jgi:hypothetical protein
MMSAMDPVPRARASSAKNAARLARPRRKIALVVMLACLALLLLGWATMTLRRAKSTQVRRKTEGVFLAQRRAGEIPQGSRAPLAPPRSPASNMPASPTPLPMPETQPTDLKRGPRYLIHDPPPPRPTPGHLFVDTQPESTVWIDGEAKGKTPLDVMVGSGPKALRLEAAGFLPVRETFEASQGASIRRALVPLIAPP